MKTPVFIRIYQGDRLIEVKQFTEPQIVIGSGETAAVRIEGGEISVIHAMIEMRETGYFLSDLGSHSGTFKNGDKVLDVALASGDHIRVGGFTLEFFNGLPKPTTPPPGAPTPPAQPVTPPAAPSKPVAPVQPVEAVVAIPPVRVTTPEPKAPEPEPTVGAKPVVEAKPVVTPQTQARPEVRVEPKSAPPVENKSSYVFQKSGKGRTFAPPSAIQDLDDVMKPTRGSVIEVVTAWRERVLSTYHFNQRKVITIGGAAHHDIRLPIFGNSKGRPLLRLDAAAVVYVRLDMGGVLRRDKQALTFAELMGQNRLIAQPGGLYGLMLEQGESLRLDFPNEVHVYVRYVNSAPKPLLAPAFDFTSTELTGFVMSFVLTAILGLYMALYTPPPQTAEQKEEEVVRTAVFIYQPPKPPPPPPPMPDAPKAEVEKHEEKKEQPKTVAKDSGVTKAPPVKAQTDKNQGKVAEIRPKKNDKKTPKVMTSVKQGGEIKTAQKDGANMQSVQKKDVNKTGLLGVFGSKGAQNELDQANSGQGELQGLANNAKGTAGSSANRPGEGLGAALKDTGAGGKGTATVGIAGIGTNGTGLGKNGYGMGGLGSKTGTLVIPGGAEESFDTQIDREAIRRVVRQHLREVQYCYERELNHDPNLSGKVLVTWEIGPGGRVMSASVTSSTIDSKSVGECLVARLKTWRFPEPPADKNPNVTYPFLFQKN